MPDAPNPSDLIVGDALVSASNPVPVSSASAGAPASDIAINPRTLLVNGAPVSEDNPLPINFA
jgi:hypothetical protein